MNLVKREDICEKIESLTLEKAKLDSKLRDADRGKTGEQRLVSELDRKYARIDQEKVLFGKEDTDYAFDNDKVSQNKQKLVTMENKQKTLGQYVSNG